MKPDVLVAPLCGLLTEIYIFHLDWSTVIFQEEIFGWELWLESKQHSLKESNYPLGSSALRKRYFSPTG